LSVAPRVSDAFIKELQRSGYDFSTGAP